MIWQLLSQKKESLFEIISERENCFPSSDELNFNVTDADKCLQSVKDLFVAEARSINYLDGLSMSFKTWRFNLRKSNTEPLVRLNVEARGDKSLLARKTAELKKLIKKF
jgi:phosphomannomutase